MAMLNNFLARGVMLHLLLWFGCFLWNLLFAFPKEKLFLWTWLTSTSGVCVWVAKITCLSCSTGLPIYLMYITVHCTSHDRSCSRANKLVLEFMNAKVSALSSSSGQGQISLSLNSLTPAEVYAPSPRPQPRANKLIIEFIMPKFLPPAPFEGE